MRKAEIRGRRSPMGYWRDRRMIKQKRGVKCIPDLLVEPHSHFSSATEIILSLPEQLQLPTKRKVGIFSIVMFGILSSAWNA